MLVTFTDAAQARLLHLLRLHDQPAVRLNVGESELGGLRYWFEFAEGAEPGDETLWEGKLLLRGVPEDHPGLDVDFVAEGMDSRFTFKPKVPSGGCGCNTGTLRVGRAA